MSKASRTLFLSVIHTRCSVILALCQKVIEWWITKMEVEHEMEIFIISTKYNCRLQHEEGTHCKWWLLSQQNYPLTNMRNGTYPLMFTSRVYNSLVLWHINHCRLFNAKNLYTYILDIYNLVWFGFMAYQPL